jgi:hypothetical protein
MNTMSEPETIRTVKRQEQSPENGRFKVEVPKYSFTEIVLG